jgi:nitroimidazol reductase NimA-like FMN-containing flavoprotein (pyridoxamine 5'-phosphate oxidase superfamily)
MTLATAPSARTRVRRKPERAHYETEAINAIVDAAVICSVAFQIDGAVHAIPTIHWRDGEYLYIHGAKASRMLKALTESEACLTIALADGLVLARSAMHHSMNYRSVVIYGRFDLVTDPVDKERSLRALIDGLYPDRWETLRPINGKELNATSVLRIPLTEASAKVRDTGVKDDDEDLDWPVWAGVIPLNTGVGTPRRENDSVGRTVPATRYSPPPDNCLRAADKE